MKFIAPACFLFFCLLFLPGDVHAGEGNMQEADWLENIEEAKLKAAEENRPVLISFSGSDWCLPCMRLERDLFSTEDFINFSHDNLVLLKLDFPARKKNLLSDEQLKHNEALAEIYNKKGTFPLVIITNTEGDIIGKMDHPLSSSEAYINSIQTIIK